MGLASTGVMGVESLDSFSLTSSSFFSWVRRKTLMVVRSDLFGVQSSAETGLCSQTGHVEGRVDWPVVACQSWQLGESRGDILGEGILGGNVHVSQMACTQHGRRKALMANLLQMAQRNLMGMSSGLRELLAGER